MLSERLLEFLEVWCGPGADAEDTAELLRGPGGAYYRQWLPSELGRALRSREINPRLMSDLLSMHFDDQLALDRWFQRRWSMWFAEPFPG